MDDAQGPIPNLRPSSPSQHRSSERVFFLRIFRKSLDPAKIGPTRRNRSSRQRDRGRLRGRVELRSSKADELAPGFDWGFRSSTDPTGELKRRMLSGGGVLVRQRDTYHGCGVKEQTPWWSEGWSHWSRCPPEGSSTMPARPSI